MRSSIMKSVEEQECLCFGRRGNKAIRHDRSLLPSCQHNLKESGIVDQWRSAASFVECNVERFFHARLFNVICSHWDWRTQNFAHLISSQLSHDRRSIYVVHWFFNALFDASRSAALCEITGMITSACAIVLSTNHVKMSFMEMVMMFNFAFNAVGL